VANATVSRIGQSNLSGDVDALFRKLYMAEVMTVFNAKTVMKDKHRLRQIKGGKSASFPLVGRNTAAYHTPGAEIVGQTIRHAEQVITADALLISDVFIASIDEAMNHYDVRAPYSRACGEALAQVFDKNIMRQLCLACRASHPITGEPGGKQVNSVDITSGTDAQDAKALYNAIRDAKQALEEDNVDGEPYVLLTPALYYMLQDYDYLMDIDYDGGGSIGKAKLGTRVAGCIPVVSNNAEYGTNVTGTYGNKYNVDMTNTIALVWMPDAVGTVQLMDLAVETAWDIRRQGTLTLAKMAVGHGVLDPTYAVEITTAAAAS
jgi:hypothetical protein